MGRKRRRRRSRNPIHRVFALINKIIRNLQRHSRATKKRRKRQKIRSKNLISPIFALGSKFLDNPQQPFVSTNKKTTGRRKRKKSRRKARLEIRAHGRNIKITRIQK